MGHESRVSFCHKYTMLAAWKYVIQSRFPVSWRLLPTLAAVDAAASVRWWWCRSGLD